MRAAHPGVLGAIAFVLAAGLATCLAGSPALPRPAPAWPAALLAAMAAWAAGARRPRRARGGTDAWPARLLLVAAAATLAGARAPAARAPEVPPAPRPVALQARLLEWHPDADGGWGVADRLRDPGGRPLCAPGERLLLLAGGPRPAPPVGARLALEGLLTADGGRPRLERASWRVLARAAPPPVTALRNAVRARLHGALGEDAAGMARALLLGERHALPPSLREAYRRFGLLHLLAVSGLHFWLWDALLRRVLGARGAIARWTLLGVAALLAGAGPPVMRALTAILVRDAVARRGRRVPPLVLWSAALWGEVAAQSPETVGLGLVLSYSATFFLLAGAAPATAGRLRRAMQASWIAFLGAMPWLHAVQGTIEPWSIPLSPPCALLLPLRLSLALLALVPGSGPLADLLLDASLRLETALFATLDDAPASPWVATQTPSLAVALVSAAGLCAARCRHRTLAGACALLPWAVLLMPMPSRPGLTALRVGHGLAVVVAGRERSLGFDLGSGAHAPTALVDRVYLPALARRRWPLPDRFVLSHGDGDHVNGLAVLRERHPLRVLDVPPGAVRSVPGMEPWTVEILGCRAARRGVSNAAGHVLDVRAPGFRAVLLGDQFGFALRDLSRRLDPGPVDLLLLPHHGLTTEGLGELLAHLRPRRCWSSSGAANLPLPVAPLLARRGIPWRSTLRDDLVRFLDSRHPVPKRASSR